MNTTHRFNHDSKMSIQLGVVKRGQETQSPQDSKNLLTGQHQLSTQRPFDSKTNNLSFADRMNLNKTIQHDSSFRDTLPYQKQFVDVSDHEYGDPDFRKKMRITEKK